MRIAHIKDEHVLNVLGKGHFGDPTYYIANKIRDNYPTIETGTMLRKMKDMESRGLVERVDSNLFKSMHKWNRV